MGFQIKNKEGIAISIDALDKEVCEFWNKPYDEKSYCFPEKIDNLSLKERIRILSITENWCDKLGWRIDQGITSWDDIMAIICWPWIESGFTLEELTYGLKDPGPWIRLIHHWKEKGYVPHQVKD